MIVTKNKKKFLKSEHKSWEYWKRFTYTEYWHTMEMDAIKCKCGVYYWKGFIKPCKCTYKEITKAF